MNIERLIEGRGAAFACACVRACVCDSSSKCVFVLYYFQYIFYHLLPSACANKLKF